MMQLSIRPLWSLFVCLLLVSLSLASCSGFGTTTSSTNAMTLKVAKVSNTVNSFPLYVAEQENFLKAQGLTLDPPTAPGLGTGPKLTVALETGSVEVAVGAITDAFTLARIDSEVKILGALTTGYPIDIIVSKNLEQQTHLTETSPLAEKVKALVGKKIGISAPGSSTDALLTYLFRQQGLDAQRDAVKVNLGSSNPAAGLAALRTGRVDALSFTMPTGQQAEAQGIGDMFISPVHGDVPSMQGLTYGVFYAKQSVIDAKPKAVQAFIRAIAQAEAFIDKNPAQTTVLLKKYLQLDQKITKAVLTVALTILSQTPQISQQGYDTATQFHVKAGLIAIALAYNDLVAIDTINKAR